LIGGGAGARTAVGASVPEESNRSLLAHDAVEALEVERELDLRSDRGDDAHAGREAERVHGLDAPWTGHGYPHALGGLAQQWDDLVLLRQLRREQSESYGRHLLELVLAHDRDAPLFAQKSRKGLQVQHLEVDEVRAEASSVDHLRFERLVELPLGEQALLKQDFSEACRHVSFGFSPFLVCTARPKMRRGRALTILPPSDCFAQGGPLQGRSHGNAGDEFDARAVRRVGH
jgi:hypothetical protein